MNKVWIVDFDGYLGGYGSYSYLLGVYDSEEKANAEANKLKEHYTELRTRVSVRPVMVNATYKVKELTDWDEIVTDFCLGGYAE